jgi:HK97 family phage portal protein
MFSKIRKLLTRRSTGGTTLMYAPFGRVLYTSGDHVYSPTAYRSEFDLELARVLGTQSEVDDATLARAFGVSATAFACAHYRANVIAGIPLAVVDDAGARAENTPLRDFIAGASNVLFEITLSLLIYGRAYLLKERNQYGHPTGLRPLNPQLVTELTGTGMRVTGYDIRDEHGMMMRRADVDDVVYMQLYDTRPGGRGLSPFEVAWRDLNLEQGIVLHAASFFVNSARIDGMLTFEEPLSQDDYERAKREWQQNFRSATRAHKTAVMPAGARWTPIQAAPADLAMDALRREERAAIASIFNVDLALIGMADVADQLSANSTYSAKEIAHIRSVALPFLRQTILPTLQTQWADYDFPYHRARLIVDEAAIPQLAEAQLVRAQTMSELVSAGLIDTEEARQRLGFPTMDDAAVLRRPPEGVIALYQAGLISQSEARRMLFGRDIPLATDDLIIIDGRTVPRKLAAQYAEENAQAPASPFSVLNDSASPAVEVRSIEPRAAELKLVAAFKGHALIRAARSELSNALTEAGVDAHWGDDNWAVTLAQIRGVPGAVRRALDLTGMRAIDLRATGAIVENGQIALILDDAGAWSGVTAALRDDLDAVNAAVEFPPLRVTLGHVHGTAPTLTLTEFPLVVVQFELMHGRRVLEVWRAERQSHEQARELRNWEHVAVRRGRDKALEFRAHTLDAVVDAFIRLSLEDEDADLERVFELAQIRMFRDTFEKFIAAVESTIYRAATGAITRQKFGGEMRSLLRRYGLVAFRDGMNEVGYDPESFGPEELEAFREWQARQSEFVTGIADEIYKEGGLLGGAERAAARARMWGLVSLESAREAGILIAAPNQRMEWVLGQTEEHCKDCIRLNGQVHTMKEWVEAGWTPTSGKTECKSFNCQCKLVPTKKRRRGKF